MVVDNASQDGSFELARKNFPKAHFILNTRNLGFAAGINPAIRFALEKFADYVFLLNNDAILEKNALSELINIAEKNEKNGIVSPVILRPNNSNWFAGGKIRWFRMRNEHIFKIKKLEPYETEFASGCAMLVRKEVFRDIGLFSEEYFLYYEDIDFSWRVRQKGFKILVVPNAKIIHFEKSEETKPQKIYWLVLSGLIFFKKNTLVIWRPWIRMYIFLRKIKNCLDVKFKKNEINLAVQKAYHDYYQDYK